MRFFSTNSDILSILNVLKAITNYLRKVLQKILHILSADIAEALNVKAASLLLIDEDNQTLELVASYGLSEKYLNRGPLSVEKSITDTIKKGSVVIKDGTD